MFKGKWSESTSETNAQISSGGIGHGIVEGRAALPSAPINMPSPEEN